MTIRERISRWFGRSAVAAEPPQGIGAESFVYVKIPEDIGPLDRGEKYEDPIDAELGRLGLGAVSGGGSQLGGERPDGSQAIEFCGIDVDVTDLERALVLLRDLLPRLGAPAGTELHYTRGGSRLQDVYDSGAWGIGRPREMLHPGFGV